MRPTSCSSGMCASPVATRDIPFCSMIADADESRNFLGVQGTIDWAMQPNLRLLAERAALGQASLTTGGLRENLGTRAADNNGLGVREDGGDGEAAGALDVHEERVGVLHKSLELVRASLLLGGGVKKVDGESLMGKA